MEGFSKSEKRRCIYVNSQVSSSITNNFHTSNSDNVIGNKHFTHISIQAESSFNILCTLKKETGTDLSISNNKETN